MSDTEKVNRAFAKWLATAPDTTDDPDEDAYLAYCAGYAQAEADAAGKE